MKVITSWPDRIDIDALRSALGLYEVKTILDESVDICLSHTFAPSITPSVQKLIVQWERKNPISRWLPDKSAKLILVDVSDTRYLEHKAHYNLDSIVEIYDHHFESREFRQEKIGDNAHIISVGSCTTLIAQLAIDHDILDQLSDESVIGLALTIVFHTLNFQSSVTTDQDKTIYTILCNEMQRRIIWSDSLVSDYFSELEWHVISDLHTAFDNDSKYDLQTGTINCAITQCEVRDGKKFIHEQSKWIAQRLDWLAQYDHAFLTIPSIGEGQNYIFSYDPLIQKQLTEITGWTRHDNLLITNKLRLRKELVRELIKMNA